jgi:hypothetical protein
MATNNAVNSGLSGTTGTGNFVGSTSPTLITPAIGTPSAGVLTSCTGYTIANLSDVAWTSWTPGFTGFSADPTSLRCLYKQIGKTVFLYIGMGTPGTSNATGFTITTLPVAYKNKDVDQYFVGIGLDNGALTYVNALLLNGGGTTITLCKGLSSTAATWTNSGDKAIYSMSFTYEAA